MIDFSAVRECLFPTASAAPALPPGMPLCVMAFVDGPRRKGYVLNFSPTRDRCQLLPSPKATIHQAEWVELKKLKAIFFLRDPSRPATDPQLMTSTTTTANMTGLSGGRKLEITFADKERLQGTTNGYSSDRLGFFMVPEDPSFQILRVFVINVNANKIRWL